MINLKAKIIRALFMKCPSCGGASIIKFYMKKVSVCKNCKQDFSNINADDGPAWATLVIVGHMLAPFLMMKSIYENYSNFTLVSGFLSIGLALILFTLPIMKSIFISIIWNLTQS